VIGITLLALHHRVINLERELSLIRRQPAPLDHPRDVGMQPLRFQLQTNGTSPIHRRSSPSAIGPKHSGKIWGEGEVNGWKYYDIPLLAN
jgi:hypothetical protein